MSTTAANVIDTVLGLLDESTSSPIFWSRAELLTLLNEGMLEFTLIACHLTSERTYAMIGAKLQSVPDGAIAIMHIAYSSKRVEKTTVENFDRVNTNWDAQTGILTKWGPCGLDRWFNDRTPAAAYNVTLTTLNQPAVLAEADTIDLDQEYIDALTFYVFHMARFKESGAELQQSMDLYDQFRGVSGHKAQRTFAQEFTLYSRDPNSDTGGGYSTMDRS